MELKNFGTFEKTLNNGMTFKVDLTLYYFTWFEHQDRGYYLVSNAKALSKDGKPVYDSNNRHMNYSVVQVLSVPNTKRRTKAKDKQALALADNQALQSLTTDIAMLEVVHDLQSEYYSYHDIVNHSLQDLATLMNNLVNAYDDSYDLSTDDLTGVVSTIDCVLYIAGYIETIFGLQSKDKFINPYHVYFNSRDSDSDYYQQFYYQDTYGNKRDATFKDIKPLFEYFVNNLNTRYITNLSKQAWNA